MKLEIVRSEDEIKWNNILSLFNFDLIESSYNYCKVFKLYKKMLPEMCYFEEEDFKNWIKSEVLVAFQSKFDCLGCPQLHICSLSRIR